MEMGKLTAKFRDAVPVCLLVDDKEIKRYKNIEIPDELKKLEYRDFKFDVPLNGSITFKIMFDPGVLPEEFPQTRERKTRKPFAPKVQPQDAAPATEVVMESEPQQESHPQDEQATEVFPTSMAEVTTHALEDTKAAGEPVATAAMMDSEDIKAEIIEVEGEGRLVVITVEPDETVAIPEATETTAETDAQSEDSEPAKKLVRKGKIKKGVAFTEDAHN